MDRDKIKYIKIEGKKYIILKLYFNYIIKIKLMNLMEKQNTYVVQLNR